MSIVFDAKRAGRRTLTTSLSLLLPCLAFHCTGAEDSHTSESGGNPPAGGTGATSGASGGGGATSSTGGVVDSGGGQVAVGGAFTGGAFVTGGAQSAGGETSAGGEVGAGGSGASAGLGPHVIVSSLVLDPTRVRPGDTLEGMVTTTNDGAEPVTLLNLVIALRPPGGTHAGGPFEDMEPGAEDITLAPGESYTLQASRPFTASDPTGTWEAFATYEDASGYHDQASVFFELAGGGGSGGAGGTAGAGGSNPGGGTAGTPTGGAGGELTPVGVHGQLRVSGNKIVDRDGTPVTLHGMSMYDWSEQGRQFYNASAVGHLAKDVRCAVLRIPILPRNYPSAVDRVRTVVDACIANGIYAIIDWHSMGGANADAASSFFAEMAREYGDTPNVMYEPWNEPVDESWSTIKAYHERVVRAIRAEDPDNVIILGTPRWDQRPDQAAADPVTTSANLAYTFHFYAASHSVSGFGRNVTTALDRGIALFVTEYGGCEANGSGEFDAAELRNWWTFLDSNDIGSTNWAVETNRETSSCFQPDTSATGPWSDGDLTLSGRTVFEYIGSQYDETVAP